MKKKGEYPIKDFCRTYALKGSRRKENFVMEHKKKRESL
jgi:hypothetical protein